MEYASFSQPQEPVLPAEGIGFPLRALARILDLIVHNMAVVGFSFVAGLLIGLAAEASGAQVPEFATEDVGARLISGLFGVIGYILYSSICEAYYGATLGKMILGLFVVDKKGEQISFGAALVRSLLFYVDQFFFGLVGYMVMKENPMHQRLGDKAAGTVVIKRSEVRSSEIPSGCMMIIVLVVALAFDAVIQIVPVLFMAAGG